MNVHRSLPDKRVQIHRVPALYIDPCIPRAWRGFQITLRYHAPRYEIVVQNPRGVSRGVQSMQVDDVPLPPGSANVMLTDDGATHRIRVVLGES